ncbi:hypothetical protein BD309DRAFT_990209 [Dichomitus squalens]|nr:hypothetical protein BD309DRAFT_990209 [Dichomitus squalens]
MVAVAATTATSRAPSRAPSVAPSASRARTPSFVQGQEIPSSPLSPTPSSIADGDAVFDLMDVDLDAESSALVAGPSRSSHSSRAASPVSAKAKRHAVAEPPRKKARRDNDADISGARTKPKHKIKRSRTPTFTDSESEAEVQKAVTNVPKRIDAKRLSPEPYPHLAKVAHKKRPRAILSDDETDLDASPTAPPPAPKKDGERERKKDKRKKPRAKGSAPDPELENEPLHASMSAAKPKAAKSSSAPKSATNIARPELPSAPVAPAAAKPREAAPHKAKPFTSTAAAGKSRASRAHDDDAESLVNVYELPLPAPELEGMLVETLATARASSLATSALYGALMAARPALRDMALPTLKDAVAADEDDQEKDREATGKGRGAKADAASRRAWVPAIEAILEAGWRRCGVFGKVVNSGTDLANHSLSLEARWFYDPDQDADADRATLVRSMMRRPGKRSETKKAKQYYWRPLPKISRWDAEDEL